MKSYDELEVIDVLGLMTETDGSDEQVGNMPADEALFKCLNTFGDVNIEYISSLSGLSALEVTEELRGAIYQDPESVMAEGKYDLMQGWTVSARYLSGNVRAKLTRAKQANALFPGKFDANVEKLRSILPEWVDIDGIHLALGASWIPVEEIALFIEHLLNLVEPPQVFFYEDLLTYKIVPTVECDYSVLNTITYGVKGDTPSKQYLTAIDIIEQTMNAKTIKVFDYIPRSDWRSFEPVLNRTKTLEAQSKQQEIIEAFRDYVLGNDRRVDRFEQYYNDELVGYTYSQYDGSFLRLPDLNPAVTLYEHQRNAIARVLLSDSNLLLAHDVGTGKTYEMIVSIHELYRMGVSQKNLVVVPNNVLHATEQVHKYLYENDRILTVYPKDFTPAKRNRTLELIRDGDFVAVYMAYSSFDMVVMSKEYHVTKMKREIKELGAAIYNSATKHERTRLTSRKESLEKKLSKYSLEQKECPWLTYDELGITTLVVDEAHNYKNIPIYSMTDGIVGMGGSSKKCREMLEKAHFTNRLIFATGTPLTNSLADLFTLQTYLQPATLEYHRISTFDTWINTFGQRETAVECDVDANSRSLRTVTRFSSFHNLSELMSLFSQVCDFHYQDNMSADLPLFNGHENVRVPKNRAQREYINSLSERTELIRAKQVKRNEDNLLKITTDGRLAALDIRLVTGDASPYTLGPSKTDACAQKVAQIYRAFPDSVQVVFSDVGTPKAGFNIYDELAARLCVEGIPRHQIAFVHDATTDKARAKLFEAMNKGDLRVVIGSTQKLGVGVNVQERLVALHHLSVPWRPADMVQREGRILRRGNTSPEIFMFRYITEGSFDAYSWQLLENKQKFISAFLSGTSALRDSDDIADAVLTYAEVKALAVGNPLIKRRIEVANSLERAKIAFRSRQKEMRELKTVMEAIPGRITELKRLAKLAKQDAKYYKRHKETISNADRTAFGEELIAALLTNADMETSRFFDLYQGFRIYLPAHMSAKYPYVIIKRSDGGEYRCDMPLENKTPLGCTKSLDNLLDRLLFRSIKLNRDIETERNRFAEAKKDLARDNPHASEIEAAKKELSDIDFALDMQAKDDVPA